MEPLTVSLIMLTIIAVAAGILVFWERRHHKKG
jgi:hypothetical protein